MRTIVIGAGPAGLNAALHAAKIPGSDVIVLEKNEKAGKKLFITGKGRCNVTNACTPQEFIAAVMRNPHFLHSAWANFSSQDTMEFLESQGVPVVVERGQRVFPKSYHAYDVTDAFVKACRHNEVKFFFGEGVKQIEKTDEGFLVRTPYRTFTTDYVVIATGGLAYPSTGSTGDGYVFAKDFGHETIPCVPGLTGIKIKDPVPSDLLDFGLKNVTLSAVDGKFHHEEFGELTFREGYMDGPIAVSMSSYLAHRDLSNIKMKLDLKPALSEEKLLERISRDIDNNPKCTIEDLLRGLMPFEFGSFFLMKFPMNLEEVGCTFSKERRRKLAHDLKNIPLTIYGVNPFERAIITVGGINTKEVNSSTMESKLVPGLYFAGEVLDVDALTGGFNIQIALSTGALAGDSIAEKVKEASI